MPNKGARVNERVYYPIVSKHFERQGFRTFIEHPAYGAYSTRVDVMAVSGDGEIVSTEVKMRFRRRHIGQILRLLRFSDFVYLALPRDYYGRMRRTNRRIIERLGVGIILMNGKGVLVERAPRRSPLLSDRHKRYVLQRAKHYL